MKKISLIDEIYSASETAAITGVSTALQRDWRRPERAILPPLKDGKHARFNVGDIGYLLALKSFTAQGISVSQAKDAASISILPVEEFVRSIYLPACGTPLPPFVIPQPRGRFVIASGEGTRRMDSLADWESKWVEPQSVRPQPLVSIVFDCLTAATLILSRVPRPPLRIEIWK